MKKQTLFLVTCLVVGMIQSAVFAASKADVSVITYFVPTNYSSSAKTDTNVVGAYSYLGYKSYSAELEYDSVTATEGGADIQKNMIGIVTYYGVPYKRFKVGVQHVDAQTGGKSVDVAILGMAKDQVSYYGYMIWTLGIDGFVSKYDDITPYQISPYLTLYMGAKSQASLTTKINTQFISDNDPDMLNTIEATYKYNWNAFSISASAIAGQSKYGVYNGGFVAYNTDDTLYDGIALSATYYASNKLSFTLDQEKRRLIVSGASDISDFSKTSFMVNYHF